MIMFAVAKIVNMIWSDNEIQNLINDFSTKGTNYCVNQLNRTKSAILNKANVLKLTAQRPNLYTNEEILFLKNNYSIYGVEYCAEYMKRNKNGVCNKARELNLFVDDSIKSNLIINGFKKKNYNKYDVDNILLLNNLYIIYFLGYFWADGHLDKNRTLSSISLIKEDSEFLYNILIKFSNCWKIGSDLKKYWKNSLGEIKQGKLQRIIWSSSQELFYFLEENDYKNKSRVNFNKIFNKIPENLKSFFILGLYDGDGHFNYQKRYKNSHQGEFIITSSYDYDWSTLEQFYKKNNIDYSIYRQICKLGKNSDIKVRKKESLIKLYELLYKDEFKGLERKHIKYLNYYEAVKK
jgi:hypothetical protein